MIRVIKFTKFAIVRREGGWVGAIILIPTHSKRRTDEVTEMV